MAAAAKMLDAETMDVLKRIPDADFIHVGRELMIHKGEPAFKWCISFYMPRRNKAYRVMSGRTIQISTNGDTLSEAKENAVRDAHYHRTGKFPTEEG